MCHTVLLRRPPVCQESSSTQCPGQCNMKCHEGPPSTLNPYTPNPSFLAPGLRTSALAKLCIVLPCCLLPRGQQPRRPKPKPEQRAECPPIENGLAAHKPENPMPYTLTPCTRKPQNPKLTTQVVAGGCSPLDETGCTACLEIPSWGLIGGGFRAWDLGF